AYEADRRSDSAESALEGAESRRELLAVRSPIAGVVLTHRPQDLTGRFVVEGTDLLEIADTRRMAVDVNVSERLFPYLGVGQTARVLVRTDPLRSHVGKLVSISAMTAGAPGTATAEQAPPAPAAYPEAPRARAVFEESQGKQVAG